MKKNAIVFIFFICGFFASIKAQVPNDELKQALSFFESGDYAHAKAEYESLLEDSLDPWKKQLLNYNIGTVLLANGNWAEAIRRFQAVLAENVDLPLLKQRTNENLMLAQIVNLTIQLEALKKNIHATYSNYNDMFILFRQALQEMNNAFSAWCELETREGAEQCSSSSDLQSLQLQIKSLYNQFLKDFLNYRLTHSSIQEEVSEILFGETALSNQLVIFQEAEFSENLEKEYIKIYSEQAESWKPFFAKLAEAFKTNSKSIHFEKQKEFFKTAQGLFLESLALAQKGNFQESLEKLKKSRQALNELLHQFIRENPLKESLHQLLIAYELALFKEPLQQASINQIFETQTALEEIIKKTEEPSISANYQNAQKYLSLSLRSLSNFHAITGRLYAEIASFYLKNIGENIDFLPKIEAETVLKNAIGKEEFILHLNHLAQQAEKENEKDLIEIDSLMPELQLSVIKTADQFSHVVLARQKEAFTSNTTHSRCQCQPWDEVLPLYHEGYTAALSAHQLLKKNDLKLIASAELLQKKAVERWKEALEKIHASSSRKKASQDQQQSQSKQQQEKQPETMQPENAGQNDILHLVQEMEKDDRSKPQIKTLSGSNGDERPW